MPKFPTFPILFDECKTICISDLKRWGYLEPGQWKTGVVTWSRQGNKTGSISIGVNFFANAPYLELDYTFDKTKEINYQIELTAITSNLTKGKVWYFICPYTGKRCRKLYLVDGYFYHRSAFRGCLYEKQTYSRSKRDSYRNFDLVFGVDIAYEKIYSKYFKASYAGKPTKQYLRLRKRIARAGRISEGDLLRF